MTVLELPLGKCQCSVCYQPTDEAESFSVQTMKINDSYRGEEKTYKYGPEYIVCEPCLINAQQDACGTDYSIDSKRRFPAIPSIPQKG